MMEPVSYMLGLTAAKFVFGLWVKDTIFEGPTEDLIALAGRHISDRRSSRKAARQFEELAEEIADRLEPFLKAEMGDLDEGTRTSAALAVKDSLEAAIPTLAKLLDVDLQASAFEAYVREIDPNAVQRAGLGDAGAAIYDAVLSECAGYITAVASQLPNFLGASIGELLGRSSGILEICQQILNNLPQSAVPKRWGLGSEDQRFENKYRRAVAEYSSRLQIFGVTAESTKRAYPISTAYISLSIDIRPKADARRLKIGGDETVGHDPGITHVEELLESTDRLLLTGGAGSGKTTLVQWLARSAVEGPSSAKEKRSWIDRIPYLIQLRRYVGKELPRPESFIETVAPNLLGAMPVGWAHRVLAEGRAIILVDGLDEVSVEQRAETREWLLGLISDFPDCKVLVTSRSTAVTKAWEEIQDFRHASLLPMEWPEIRAFIAHWHAAAIEMATSASLKTQLEQAEKSITAIVRDRTPIRSLCNTPLLCALICALHGESGSSLPTNRMDLYKTAIEMLVVRRDSDRRLLGEKEVDLDYSAREILLRTFALWLHDNGASDAERADYVQKIDQQLGALHRVTARAEEVAQFLLERSGILREPIPGRVDFVHRTFLEYLASKAIVDDNSIEKLVIRGHEDHWREVIIMAAGHANIPQRERLLNGLLDRGAAEPTNRHRLYILAVACMETSSQLSGELHAKLQAALGEVLPPSNMTEAAAVASAGSLATGMLARSGLRAVEAAACVRALSLIGGEEALAELAKFQSDNRLTVTRQLIRAWSSFDAEKYASLVLANSPLEAGRIAIADPEQMRYIPLLKNAERIHLDMPSRLKSFRDLPSIVDKVERLDISYSKWLLDFADAPRFSALRSLSARRCPNLASAAGIERYREIVYLDLEGSPVVEAAAIDSLPSLRYLDLSGSRLGSLDFLRSERILDRLSFFSAIDVTSVGKKIPAVAASVGTLSSGTDVSGLAYSDELRTLSLYASEVVSLDLPAGLEQLSMFAAEGSILRGGAGLRRIVVWGQVDATNFGFISGLEQLDSLSIQDSSDSSFLDEVRDLVSKSYFKELTLYRDIGGSHEDVEIPGMRKLPSRGSVWRFVRA